MSPIERLRCAVAPEHYRSTLLLWGGLAAFAASGGISAFIELPPLLKTLLYPVMFASWSVAACGMVGYVRWFFGQASVEARKMHSLRQKD
jgi:hypothetical protein